MENKKVNEDDIKIIVNIPNFIACFYNEECWISVISNTDAENRVVEVKFILIKNYYCSNFNSK